MMALSHLAEAFCAKNERSLEELRVRAVELNVGRYIVGQAP